MLDIGSRIALARGDRTQRELAASVGVSRGHLARLEAGSSVVTEKVLTRIAFTLGVSLELLASDSTRPEDILRALGKTLDPDGSKGVRPREHPQSSDIVRGAPLVNREHLARWDWVSVETLEKSSEMIPHTLDDPDTFAVRADEKELSSQRFPIGTLLILSPRSEIRHNDYVLARTEGGPILRRYVEVEGRKELRGGEHQRHAPLYPDTRMIRVRQKTEDV